MTPSFAHLATSLTAFSKDPVSATIPAPSPSLLVGVSTQRNTISASITPALTSFENTKFGFLPGLSTAPSSSVQSNVGSVPSRVIRIRSHNPCSSFRGR
ncbi:hypothetical protein GJ744_007497 [Endocarpon pusillum]|uniref:Uncharacterized protein n=1 Tax=Endocarpon pusillum TaxID=364733 RepID=A0A8H7E586_9EURO|nr:hypothetical protein GJ744_007497 [Endocarpon pusillum]